MEHNLDNIPTELEKLDQWVIYKGDKRPRNPRNNDLSDVSDPKRWDSFENACKAAKQYRARGVGFVFTEDDDYCGIDLDKAIGENGVIDPEAQAIIDKLDSYSEVSQSGRGIHIIVRGKKPGSRCRSDNVEIYDKSRYFALTGMLWQDRAVINGRQAELDWLCEETFGGASETTEAEPVSVILSPDAEPPKDKLKVLLEDDDFKETWEHKKGLPSLSDYDWKLACHAIEADWEDQEIANLITAFRRRHGDAKDSKKAMRKDYIPNTIAKARAEKANAPDKDTHLTDTGNAEFMVKLYGEQLRYDHKRRTWLRWGTHHWETDQDGYVTRLAREAAKLRFLKAADIKDTKFREKAALWAIASESKMKVDACVGLARDAMPFADKGDNWDTDEMLLGCENGIIDLRTGALRPGKPEDRITMSTGLDYDPNAKCPRWEKFLREIFANKEGKPDEHLIDWLWRVLGYTITGDMTEQIMMMGYGEGGNGKSKFFEAIEHALGDYAHNTPFSTFRLPQTPSTNDLADLRSRRFVVSSETNRGTKLNMERIKAISGGDKMSARHLYCENAKFNPQAKIWLFVNAKPEIDDDSVAAWRRVRLIPFTQTFIKERDDKQLKAKLEAEGQGILAWLVRGCLEWQKRRLGDAPDSVRAATVCYMRETDTVLSFIDNCSVREEGRKIRASVFYSAYKSWMKDVVNRKALSLMAFGLRMSKIVEKRDSAKGFYYMNIDLRDRGIYMNLGEGE
jgi:putative DNA primase/helicase